MLAGRQYPRHVLRGYPRLPARVFQPSRSFSTTLAHRQQHTQHRAQITRSRNHPQSEVQPKILPQDELVEEEILPGYEEDDFCPIEPGDIFNDRYQTISKIGFGSVSTVWLAKDLKKPPEKENAYVTLKVSTCGAYDKEEARHELAVMKRLHDSNPSHKGFQYIRTYNETFDVEGPVGTHVVLVQEPMREPLRQFRKRFKGDKLPPKILKGYMQYWLSALDYMHSQAHVVHTDIKDDNILMTFESPSILSTFESTLHKNPMPYKPTRHNRRIYQTHSSFGSLSSLSLIPSLADFGASHRMDGSNPSDFKLFPIQPRYYRAPEVILGAGWSYPADVWNLGVLAFTLLENHHLFRHVNTLETGDYDIKGHLAQMYALLGPVPKHMMERIEGVCKQKFEPEVENDKGEMCDTPRGYFGGPYFDGEGHLLDKELVPKDFTWDSRCSSLEGEEREGFLRLVKRMIKWDPEERAKAGELVKDEWLTSDIGEVV